VWGFRIAYSLYFPIRGDARFRPRLATDVRATAVCAERPIEISKTPKRATNSPTKENKMTEPKPYRLFGLPEHRDAEEQWLLDMNAHDYTAGSMFVMHHPSPSDEASLRKMVTSAKYKQLNGPMRSRGYVNAKTVGALVDNRWEFGEAHDFAFGRVAWRDELFRSFLPYPNVFYLAHRMNRELHMNDIQLALDALVTRIWLQTDDGWNTEKKTLDYARREDASARRATAEEDTNAHVDIVTSEYAIQVKPISFRQYARTNDGLMRDQLENFEKQLAFQEQTGIPVRYVFADDIAQFKYQPRELELVIHECGLAERFDYHFKSRNY